MAAASSSSSVVGSTVAEIDDRRTGGHSSSGPSDEIVRVRFVIWLKDISVAGSNDRVGAMRTRGCSHM